MHTHAPGRSHGRREVQRKPEDIAGFCDFVREHPGTPLKALLALVNPRFASVRAAADGRAGGYGGRPWGRARAAHPRGERGVPVQVLGEPLTENKLKHLRTVCDPTRETRKSAAPRNLNPEDIAGFCDFVREHPTTPLKALLALVNPRFASVRATADGRAGGYGGRPWGRARAAHPRGSGVCRCRS
jgi:hypothetical protein